MIARRVSMALDAPAAMVPPHPTHPLALARHLFSTGGAQGAGFSGPDTRGPTPAVQALIEWAQRSPVGARVKRVEVTEAQAGGTLGGFEQREAV